MKHNSLLLAVVMMWGASLPAQSTDVPRPLVLPPVAVVIDGLPCTAGTLGMGAFAGVTWKVAVASEPALVGGGAGVGKITLGDLVLTKAIDACTTTLLNYVLTGKHLKSLTLTQSVMVGDRSVPQLVVKLADVVVGSSSPAGTATTGGSETVTFRYMKIGVTVAATGVCEGNGC